MPKLVLAVDDEAHVRRLVQINLQRVGYRVETASDGEQALASIQAERPDLVITDVMMPKLDGFELLRRIKADPDTADIPVIMLTARSRDEDIFEGERSGAAAYLPKPFSPPTLTSAVAEVLGGPE